jgi:hypothetical protein
VRQPTRPGGYRRPPAVARPGRSGSQGVCRPAPIPPIRSVSAAHIDRVGNLDPHGTACTTVDCAITAPPTDRWLQVGFRRDLDFLKAALELESRLEVGCELDGHLVQLHGPPAMQSPACRPKAVHAPAELAESLLLDCPAHLALLEENDRSVRQTPGQDAETTRICPGHGRSRSAAEARASAIDAIVAGPSAAIRPAGPHRPARRPPRVSGRLGRCASHTPRLDRRPAGAGWRGGRRGR